jgi:hypothetical protein
MFGKCRLCLQQAELQHSHLLPRALYRMIGTGTDRVHPDTVQLTLNSRTKSSEQARRHLLCSLCEQCLNENGERWVLHNCYRGRGRFRLRSELRRRTILSGAEIEAYMAFEEEVARLSYFCLSVVWRASLCDWYCRGERYQQVELGPYQEGIRKYLKGEAPVPHRVGVMVMLSGLERPVLAMSFPFSYREDSHHCHRFHIPGVTFVATVGGGDSSMIEDHLSVLRPPHPILIETLGDKRAQEEMMLLLGKTPPRGFEVPLAEGTEKM